MKLAKKLTLLTTVNYRTSKKSHQVLILQNESTSRCPDLSSSVADAIKFLNIVETDTKLHNSEATVNFIRTTDNHRVIYTCENKAAGK